MDLIFVWLNRAVKRSSTRNAFFLRSVSLFLVRYSPSEYMALRQQAKPKQVDARLMVVKTKLNCTVRSACSVFSSGLRGGSVVLTEGGIATIRHETRFANQVLLFSSEIKANKAIAIGYSIFLRHV